MRRDTRNDLVMVGILLAIIVTWWCLPVCTTQQPRCETCGQELVWYPVETSNSDECQIAEATCACRGVTHTRIRTEDGQ